MRVLCLSVSVLALASCAAPDLETSATSASIDNTVYNGEWLTWGGDPDYTRYSPLDQINAENVGDLQVAWRWDAPPWETRPDTNMKATPIYVDGVLYAPVGVNQVVALDPATGEELWMFTPEPRVIRGRGEAITSRAVSYWTDGTEARLFHNTRDGRLISINPETGEVDPDFGENGMIYLRDNLRPDGEEAPFVGSSSPAAIVGDVVVAQMVADITPQNMEATPGHIRGFDVRTGELLWTFHTIPQPGEFGHETWENESWRYTGNTGVWSMISVDTERELIYL
ncbi:MAG TPA: quinoprotein glucose dehydrogenase, partial [Hyphomonadaceae bacterium]|nr:quinoprotein glucose dehydrogenase [Hyphomonadaceae bacterium]